MATIKILLVGESLNQHSQIAQRLACWGADRQYASSCSQACTLLKEQAFDLVISRLKLCHDRYCEEKSPMASGKLRSRLVEVAYG